MAIVVARHRSVTRPVYLPTAVQDQMAAGNVPMGLPAPSSPIPAPSQLLDAVAPPIVTVPIPLPETPIPSRKPTIYNPEQ